MADIVSTEKRSQMMSGIKGKNTRPELIVSKALHRKGFRYRKHVNSLPGKPDLVFPKHKAVLFIHGCFWHGHDCHLFKWPSSRDDFWKKKITRNQEVDKVTKDKLDVAGWRTGIIWECSLKGKARYPLDFVIEETSKWLNSGLRHFQIRDNT